MAGCREGCRGLGRGCSACAVGLLTCGGLRLSHWPRDRQAWSGVWGCPHRAVRRSRVSRGRWAKKVGWVHRRLEGEGLEARKGLTPGGGGVEDECGPQGKHLGGGVKAGSPIGGDGLGELTTSGWAESDRL